MRFFLSLSLASIVSPSERVIGIEAASELSFRLLLITRPFLTVWQTIQTTNIYINILASTFPKTIHFPLNFFVFVSHSGYWGVGSSSIESNSFSVICKVIYYRFVHCVSNNSFPRWTLRLRCPSIHPQKTPTPATCTQPSNSFNRPNIVRKKWTKQKPFHVSRWRSDIKMNCRFLPPLYLLRRLSSSRERAEQRQRLLMVWRGAS